MVTIDGTTFLTPCMCGDEGQPANTSTGRLHQMQGETEHCLDQGRLQTRLQVCSGGGSSLLGNCGMDDDDGISPIFVGVLAALLGALISAVVVGAACRFCFGEGGRVEDEGKREA